MWRLNLYNSIHISDLLGLVISLLLPVHASYNICSRLAGQGHTVLAADIGLVTVLYIINFNFVFKLSVYVSSSMFAL